MTLWFYVTMPTSVRAGSAGTGLYGYYQGVYDMAAFYPTLAVYDQNGWNLGVTRTFGDSTFTDTAYYHAQLTVPSQHQVVASGTTIDRRTNGDGTDTWQIVAGPARAFYAASSERYQFITDTVDDVIVNSYYLDGGLNGAQTALNYATGVVCLQPDVRIPRPRAGRARHAHHRFRHGISGRHRHRQSLYGDAGGAYAEAVVHEVAHQWWYNLIGNDQPDDPWLDESLANYSYYLYFEEIGWTEMTAAIMNNDFRYRYQAAQNLGIDRPVGGPVSAFDASNYINIVYSKGPLFFHAVRDRMGDEAFFAALRDYADTHRYGVVYAADLMDAFARHTDQALDDLYAFWIGS
ncbi:MAG: M1 family aminopeptidase [Caldilineaceae bacterium]